MTDTQQQAAARLDRLRERMKSVRGRGRLSLDRWLLIGGAITLAIGIPLIVLGWYGASRTPYVFEQIPYLISGGLLGLALAVVGALFYFSFWLTRQVQETRRQGEEARAMLVRLEKALLAGAAGGNGSGRPAAGPNGHALVATPAGTMVHKPDCVVVANRTDLRTISPGTPGFEPCKVCDPLGVS